MCFASKLHVKVRNVGHFLMKFEGGSVSSSTPIKYQHFNISFIKCKFIFIIYDISICLLIGNHDHFISSVGVTINFPETDCVFKGWRVEYKITASQWLFPEKALIRGAWLSRNCEDCGVKVASGAA
jgi:hypothetical protein